MSRLQFCPRGSHGLVRGMTRGEMNAPGHESATWMEMGSTKKQPCQRKDGEQHLRDTEEDPSDDDLL